MKSSKHRDPLRFQGGYMILQEKTLGYEPKKALAYFEQICKIPHGSHNEEKIADYLQSFANVRGLYCYRDAKNNVLIKLPATEKYKDSPAYSSQPQSGATYQPQYLTIIYVYSK